jgi:hypothetical protein
VELPVMENQQSWQVAPPKTERKTSLVALLFFLMGALHIYKEIQLFGHSKHSPIAFDNNPLLKVALVALVLAGILELLVL